MADSPFSSYTDEALIYSRLVSSSLADPDWALQEASYFSSILSDSNCITTELPDLNTLLSARPNPFLKPRNLALELDEFMTYPSNPSEPLVLFDQTARPVAARVPLNDPPSLIPDIESALHTLPLAAAAGNSFATRGGFKVFSYGVHADYSPTPKLNTDYVSHHPASLSFLANDATPMVSILSRWYRFLSPSSWATIQTPVLPAGLERRVGPWTTLAINIPSPPSSRSGGVETPVVNKPHLDGLDIKESMTGVVPFRWYGDWDTGKVILFPLKTILEVGRGEAYLIFGAVTLHGNLEDRVGGRGSMVMHSRASVMNWWVRQQAATEAAAVDGEHEENEVP